MSREDAFAFIQTRTAQLLRARWAGYPLAIAAVLVALGIRAALEGFGSFYYLPMLPAVMAIALLAGRRETAFSIILAIAANVALVPRDNLTDTIANALLFAAVAWLVSEGFRHLRTYRTRAGELSRRLAQRDHMLQTILASVPVVMLDRHGAVRSLTPSASTLLVASEALAVGESFGLFVEDFDLETVKSSRAAGAPPGFWVARRGDGRRLHLNIQLGINEDESDPDHAVLTLTDLTASHAAETHAREMHAQLNRVWRLNSLGEMAATLSHELNQPLSAAVTYLHAAQTDMKRAGPVAENAGRTVDMAKAQLLRAGEIIRRMRELLAHESCGLDVERTSSMISDLEGVINMIGRTGGVSIEFQIDDRNDRVWAERIQFQQAMVNLIRNAVEALDGRPDPRVVVTGRTISPESYEVRVEDNGAGIATADRETIFRPLMSTKSGGMGLGLSVTRTIIESHSGVLKVDGSPLGGAAFSFCLMRERELVDA